MNELFVYGIFLSENMRKDYGLSNPEYAVVADYVTVMIGSSIVQAYPIDSSLHIGLTGLLVDVDPNKWDALDRLEGAYQRITIMTTDGDEAYMYVAREE